MITKLFYIQCDNCSQEIITEEGSKKMVKVIAAAERGMTIRRVPNGSNWMLCQTCSKLETSELR